MSTNGHTNGHFNGGGSELMQWKVGLMNSAQRYLTAESFGFEINASGQYLKKKQTWTLEHDTKDEVVYIKSHMGRYLSGDKYGKCTCDKEACERDDCDKFVVEYAKDGTGRWALKNVLHGNYLGGTEKNVKCFSKTITDAEWWVPQLSIRPQVNIRNVTRKRYAVLCDDEIHCKEVVPWGEAGLIVLHFYKGKYGLKTCDNRFLHRDGSLVEELDADSTFTLEIKSGANCGLAFKDDQGYYLTATGATATMKSGKNKKVGKDELFTLEDTHPQVTITSQNNGKLLSVKQGVDLSANQTDVCEKSTFQMEYNSGEWAFKTCVDNKYLSLESFGGIQAACMTVSPKSRFEVESNGDGTVCIKASNSKYLYNKKTGSILCSMENQDSRVFIIRMVNRPYLIIKSDFGFVGLKPNSQKPEIICSKTNYDVTFIEPQEDGYYYLKGMNNKYWNVEGDNSILANADKPSCKFLLVFQGQSLLSIQTLDNKYLKGEQNSFLAKGTEIDNTTLWEY